MRRAGAPVRPPPPAGPWLSWKSWRRGMRIAIERGLSRRERRELLARLARVRGRGRQARATPTLWLVSGEA